MAPIKEFIYGDNSKMTTVDKYTLAYTLASAVLQLYNTPWLPTAWSSNDIFILKPSAGNTLPSQFYASRTFRSPSAQAARARTRRCIKNEMVFALGVALLEISYGQPLLSLKSPEDLNDQGMEDSMTEVSIATRLADRIHEREMDNYAKSPAAQDAIEASSPTEGSATISSLVEDIRTPNNPYKYPPSTSLRKNGAQIQPLVWQIAAIREVMPQPDLSSAWTTDA
ncbi:hypothetical protein Q9189_003670 [Teloschistes chrysophthalmus]